jgi:hypothetical protein
MTIFLWYVFGVACFTFHLLNYILVVYLHGEHEALYKELHEPSAFHFLVNRPKYFSHPYSVFILKRQYRTKLMSFPGLFRLAQWIFGSLILAVLSAIALAVHYA